MFSVSQRILTLKDPEVMHEEEAYAVPNYMAFFGFSAQEALRQVRRQPTKEVVKKSVPNIRVANNLPPPKQAKVHKSTEEHFGGLRPFEFHFIPDEMKDEGWLG